MMMLKALRISILLSMIITCAFGAGVATHLTYLARVSPDKFRDYNPWIKAGAFFPDSLYSCKPSKKLSDFAERTHWPEFLISAFELWREIYDDSPGRRETQDSLKFQAFLVGIFSHQIVDSSWHSLVEEYRSHGLLRVLAETEFRGDVDEAHKYLDVMGDFIVMSNVFSEISDLSWRYYTNTNWSLPREQDIMKLLSRYGIGSDDITYQELDVCVMRGLSASLSETYVMLNRRTEILNLAYGVSPVARDFLQDYWQGGEFDLIAMLQACLPVYQDFFESDGTLAQPLQRLRLCGNLPEVSRPVSESSLKLNRIHENGITTVISNVPRSNFGTSIAVGRFGEDDRLYAAVSAPLEESSGVVHLFALGDLARAMKPFTAMKGLAVHIYTFNGLDFLVVSEPGSNSIHFYRAHKKILALYDRRTPQALQLQLSCVADIDDDGVPDLLLSGKFYGEEETGSVILVFGSSFTRYLINNHPTEVDISDLAIIKLDGAPLNRPYQHFGAALTASYSYSSASFLYVTCQSLGIVLAYPLNNLGPLAHPKFVFMEKSVTNFEKYNNGDVETLPSSVHGMFGKTVLLWEYADRNFVAFSQHLFNRVFIYREIHGKPEFFLKVELQHDSSAFSSSIGFGSALQYDNELESLYISSPGYLNGKGSIWRINMQELINAAELWKQDTFYVIAVSHLYLNNPQKDVKGVSNFGKTMQVAPGGRLIIGAPQLNYGNLEGKQLTGAVIIK